jgi:hypothetical protein
MGKQHMLSHITMQFIFSLDFFAIIFVYYNNTIPHKSMPFGGVGDLLWKFCGESGAHAAENQTRAP